LQAGHALSWEGWRVLPFALPHDAADPVAYRVEVSGFQTAIVTDLGHPTALVADHTQDLDLLVLEANHDVDMLREGEYPPQLKARILSRVGHLSNAAMAELLVKVASPRLKHLVLAHLSESNNHPDLARFAAEEVLRGSGISLHLAHQRDPLALAGTAE
jgi:phosphoribosyl 1,2-cyclic phosphodiesterase